MAEIKDDMPEVPVKATRLSPKILILYSLPKVGKTEQLAQLPECMILDAEGGAEGYECLRYPIYSSKDLLKARDIILEKGAKRKAAGKTGADIFPYKFIALDTIDEIEGFAEISATQKYINSKLNSNHKFEEKYKSVIELPEGGGYYYLRNEVLELVNEISLVCPRLIITAHVKDKKIPDKSGELITISDLSLTGKLGAILAAKADAIGYLYRSESKDNRGELMVSFQTYESAVMGARQKYLAGQKFPFSWSRIYPDLFPQEQPAQEAATATV